MCGIAGSINFPLSPTEINNTMGHRGPDAQALYDHQQVAFYHLRLSIQDITDGHQPMHLGEDYSIIFNGEIYNHLELRKKYDLNCQSNSDTETFLHLYRKLGWDFLNEVDGMFALALLDKKQNKVFLVRDRAGKKPLYLYHHGDKIVWSSELRCLHHLVRPEINRDHIAQFLITGFMVEANTPYQAVKDVAAGSIVTIDVATCSIAEKKWWSIDTFYQQPVAHSFEEATEEVDRRLRKSVRNRMVSSDLEVGSFLSGGIDSGLISAIASEMTDSLKTFTVSFDGEYDEAPLAKLVAQKYNTDHTEIKIDMSDLPQHIEKIFTNYGEPFADTSAIPSYYVSEAAKKYLTVILNGDGADELFGGYRRYVPAAKMDLFSLSPVMTGAASMVNAVLPNTNNRKSIYNYVQRLTRVMKNKDPLSLYLTLTTDVMNGNYDQFDFDIQPVLKNLEASIKRNTDQNLTGLQKSMLIDFKWILFGDLLVKMDIATMAHSLEGRSPFMSKYMLEYAPRIKDSYKVDGKRTKKILRKLAEKYLPTALVSQPKRGFEIPAQKWIDHDLKDLVHDLLQPSSSYIKTFLKPAFVDQIIDNKIDIAGDKRSKMLWSWISLQLWYNHINR